MEKIKIVEKDWMPKDTFALVNEKISGAYGVTEIVLGKTRNTTWLERKIANWKHRRYIKKLLKTANWFERKETEK